MTKTEIKELMRNAKEKHHCCGVIFGYDANLKSVFPLIVGERLFLSAEEEDFILDGYSVRRIKDIVSVRIANHKYQEMYVEEGLIDQLNTPEINILDWKSVLISLQTIGDNIIIERESDNEDDQYFAIGKIEKVLSKKVLFKAFDAEGIWEDELWEIPFSEITSVSFGKRYITVFSKYLPPID